MESGRASEEAFRRFGSTNNHRAPPAAARTAAKTKALFQPKRLARYGVKDAVTAPPIWHDMFITPETTPERSPAMSALTAQKELCDQ